MCDNKMNFIKIIIIFILLVNLNITLKSQTSGTFLKFTNDAKLISLGSIDTIEGGISNLNLTPAIKLTDSEIIYSVSRIMDEIRYDSIISGIKLGRSNIGIMIMEAGVKGIDARDDKGQMVGRFKNSNRAIGLNYAYELNRNKVIGISIKQISISIGDNQGGSVCMDIGYSDKINSNLDIGISVSNISKGIKLNRTTEKLPTRISVMYGYKIKGMIKIVGSVNRYLEEGPAEYIIGIGYNILKGIEIRSNYAYNKRNTDEIDHIRYGIGIKLNKSEINYGMHKQSGVIINSLSVGTKF
ncbi:MAG TPA: hypothetical protein PLN68_10220 [Elusimicrobiales bacterium]|nr:hypothetical protein [Elusimicrobiales bacterium]